MASIIKLGEYELDISKIDEKIEKSFPKTILIQVPEGLRRHIDTLVNWIENKYKEKNFEEPNILIWLDSCFGACDIPINEAKILGVDLILHIGHDIFIKSEDK